MRIIVVSLLLFSSVCYGDNPNALKMIEMFLHQRGLEIGSPIRDVARAVDASPYEYWEDADGLCSYQEWMWKSKAAEKGNDKSVAMHQCSTFSTVLAIYAPDCTVETIGKVAFPDCSQPIYPDYPAHINLHVDKEILRSVDVTVSFPSTFIF